MPRVSVQRVMLAVVAVGTALAALKNANVYWAAGISIAVLAALATSIVGIIALRGRERCASSGFAVFSGMYIACALLSQLSDGIGQSFGPTLIFDSVRVQVKGVGDARRDLQVVDRELAKIALELKEIEGTKDTALIAQRDSLLGVVASLNELRPQLLRASSAGLWRIWSPGAADANSLLCVAHGVFALASGLAGTVIGKILYARSKRCETQTT
jgi:hypothetical protein